MKDFAKLFIVGMTALFLSGCGGIIDSIDENIRNTLFASTTQVDIPDGSNLISEINIVSNRVSLTQVNVSVDITHADASDLRLFLVSAQGTVITLSTNNGNTVDDFNVFFDDTADKSITHWAAPVEGVYRPEEALSNLNGENPNGIWKLYIYDDNIGDTGHLDQWYLLIDGDQ